jgi:GNAT superfamily N-acetyltransferase
MFNLNNFYRLTKDDIKKAAEVCARSYAEITLYKKATEGIKDRYRVLQVFFEVAIRYGIKYGFPYASSEKLEGISIWLPYEKADMTTWRIIRSGGFINIQKLVRIGREFITSMKGMSQLDKDRRENMAGKQYLDLMSLAVDPEHQRKGIGGRLVQAMFEKADASGCSIYVNADIDSVDFYKKHGFKTIKELSIKINNYDLLNFEMVREPKYTT